MRRARRALAVVVGLLVPAYAACVGDDPAPGATPAADSGTPNDGGSGSDAPAQADTGSDAAANDADADAEWTPAAIDQAGNLALWLEASAANLVISSGHVATWKDLSKYKHEASNASAGPSVDVGAIHGHDAIHFTDFAVSLAIPDAPSLHFGGDQIYVAVVARTAATTTGDGMFFSKTSVTATGGGPVYATGLEVFSTHPTAGVASIGAHVDAQDGNAIAWTDAVAPETFHLVTLRRPTAFSLTMTVDDLPSKSASTGSFDVSEDGKDVLVGSVKYGNITRTVDFEIAELVVVHGSSGIVADADVANLRKYLKAKYGL